MEQLTNVPKVGAMVTRQVAKTLTGHTHRTKCYGSELVIYQGFHSPKTSVPKPLRVGKYSWDLQRVWVLFAHSTGPFEHTWRTKEKSLLALGLWVKLVRWYESAMPDHWHISASLVSFYTIKYYLKESGNRPWHIFEWQEAPVALRLHSSLTFLLLFVNDVHDCLSYLAKHSCYWNHKQLIGLCR